MSCLRGPADCIDAAFALNAALHAAMLDVFSSLTSFKFSTGSCDSSVSSRRGDPSLSTITFGVCFLTVAGTSSLTGGLLDTVSVSSSLLLIRSITLLLILPTFNKSKHLILYALIQYNACRDSYKSKQFNESQPESQHESQHESRAAVPHALNMLNNYTQPCYFMQTYRCPHHLRTASQDWFKELVAPTPGFTNF